MKEKRKLFCDRTLNIQHEKQNGKTDKRISQCGKEPGTSAAECCTSRERVFPATSQWVVFGVTLILRLYYVSQKENWWIHHPDEIFQSLEVAYSEIYGYGFRPYEFLPPPPDNTSLPRSQEKALGMYSLRSFIYPRLFLIVGHVAAFFGFQGSLFLIWKMFHAGVASLTCISVYHFCVKATKSHDVAVVSVVFVSCSPHIWVLGTHTFLNSFISPLVFLLLGQFVHLITEENLKKGEKAQNQTATIHNERAPVLTDEVEPDENNVHRTYNCNGVHHCQNLAKKDSFSLPNALHLSSNTNDRMYFPSSITNGQKSSDSSPFLKPFSYGFILTLVIYIRPDVIVTIISVTIPYLPHVYKSLNTDVLIPVFNIFLSGALCGLLVGILDDFTSYGTFVISPWQWLHFNVFNNFSQRLFGKQPFFFYFAEIIIQDPVLLILGFLLISIVVCFSLKTQTNSRNELLIPLRRLSISVFGLFITYSFQGHKEVRFIHDTILLSYICCAISLWLFCQHFIELIFAKYEVRHHVIYLLVILYASSQYHNLQNSVNGTNKRWAHQGVMDSNHLNICLDFIAQQNDVTGIFTDRNFHISGGYSLLRKNVPWFSLLHREFREFDINARIPVKNIYGMKNVSVLSKLSDFIHIQNAPLLLKRLIDNRAYNYLVMKTDRQIITNGYHEVFRSGTMRVMKRTFLRISEEYLQGISKSISDTKNTTILKYEGNWLMTYGNFDLAKTKFLRAMNLDVKDIQPYQFLIELFRRKNETKNLRSVFRWCKEKFDHEKCILPPQKITFYGYENIDLS